MNAERLLAHYERIADAPDAIARLRRFILDLAVRGKLVPQDPNDEPASELLKRIAKEKARLVKAGEIRKFVGPEAVPLQDQPFNVPRNWEWVRLGDVLTKLTDGTHHSPPNGPVGDFKYITAKNIKNEGVLLDDVSYVSREVHEEIFSRCDPAKGDILYIKDGATTGVVTVNDLDEPFSMLSSVALLKLPSCLFNRLIVEFLRSPFFYEQMRGFMKGAAITRVTLKRMGPALLPLPPLAEQYRIVAKVDELMGLCDRLEAARAGREAVRDRLAAASLARLNAPDTKASPAKVGTGFASGDASENESTFQADARFALDALPALTTRPDQIKRLRQTILNLAVRGKLVPQDTKDEPASELLKRITKEKVGSKKSKAPLTGTTPNEIDGFDAQLKLPIGWAWASLDEITHVGTGLTPSKARPDYFEGGNIPWINSSSTSGDVIREAKLFVTQKAIKECRLKIFPTGSLIVALYGQGKTRGQVAELGLDATVNQACAVVQWLPSFHEIKGFVRLTLEQQYDAMRERAEGGPQPNLNVGKIKDRVFPFPPLAEQRRIVAKVDALMALCDRLEASLTATAATRRRLLDALLAEALAPVEDREREAAE